MATKVHRDGVHKLMGKICFVLLAVLSLSIPARAQVLATSGAPSGGCSSTISGAVDVTTGNNYICTAGAWVLRPAAQLGAVHSTANTAAISTATLCAAINCPAGQYEVHFNFTQGGTACSVITAGSVTFLLTWTDSNGVAHSAVALPMFNSVSNIATSGSFTFTTANGSAYASGTFHISTNGTIIQYATGYVGCTTGTGTYQLDASVVRLQ